MKMYFRLSAAQTAALAGVVALLLFPGGYAGLQCVEAERAVLCIALRRSSLQAMGGTWTGLLTALARASPQLGDMLAGATPLLARPLAVAGVPYGFLHYEKPERRETPGPPPGGLFRLGDQAAVIPSLTGDGIAIALHSGSLAARIWHDSNDAALYHRRLATGLGRQMRLAGVLHAVGMAAPLQAAVLRAGHWLPGLLRHAARHTRLDPRTGSFG